MLDFVSFVQFKKPEKHPWKSDTFSKDTSSKVALACNFTKSITPPRVLFMFLNCRIGTKSRRTSHNTQKQLQETLTGRADLSHLFPDPHEISFRKKIGIKFFRLFCNAFCRNGHTQPVFTYSKSVMERPEQCVKSVQS